MNRSTASGVNSACESIGSRSSTPYRKRTGVPCSRMARAIASWSTTPRRLPTWTVPEGVLESLTIWGPSIEAASSSAQNIEVEPPDCLADADDLVDRVSRRDRDRDLVALLATQECPADRRLIGDPAVRRRRLRRPHDRVLLAATVAFELHGGANLDVGRGVVLVDDHGVLDQRGQGLDPALDERLLVLGVLVLGVLRDVAVLLGFLDPGRHLGTPDIDHLVELLADLFETFARQVCGLVVHRQIPDERVRAPMA